MLDEIKKEINRFEELQTEYNDYGAGDTEPDGVFQHCLMGALKGEAISKVPTSAAEWALFKNAGVGDVVKKMAATTRRICTMISKTQIRDQQELTEYLTDYCWRVRD